MAGPERHLIKKYANRKLYDTRASRHDIDRINERLDRLQAEVKRSNGRVATTKGRTRKAAR